MIDVNEIAGRFNPSLGHALEVAEGVHAKRHLKATRKYTSRGTFRPATAGARSSRSRGSFPPRRNDRSAFGGSGMATSTLSAGRVVSPVDAARARPRTSSPETLHTAGSFTQTFNSNLSSAGSVSGGGGGTSVTSTRVPKHHDRAKSARKAARRQEVATVRELLF